MSNPASLLRADPSTHTDGAEAARIAGAAETATRKADDIVAGWEQVGNCTGLDRVQAAVGSVVPQRWQQA